jgi:uncharacterized protein (DUF2236 family)
MGEGRARGRVLSALSAADLDRLRAATGRPDIDPARSLFGPGSMSWRVHRERAILLGGGRALLLQVAHPLVAAGVATYSDFRTRPLDRLWRTLDLMLTLVFADAAAALAAVHGIERVHARVRGALDADAGPFPRGTRFAADDPELLLWVHATLVDSGLLAYERLVAPLDDGERSRFYEESKVAARLLGIPDRLVPGTLADFGRYLAGMLDGPALAVSAAAREIAASILDPPLPPGIRHAFHAGNLFAAGFLPPALRERYDLAWGPIREGALQAAVTAIGAVLPLLPSWARFLPHARRAGAGGAHA